jgi:hypothetical protein
MEDLWGRILEIQEFASAGGHEERITDAAVIRITLEVLEKTGVFTPDCIDWRKDATPASTYASFQDHFKKANKERIRRGGTAQTEGFHGAHAAATTTVPTPPTTANDLSIQCSGCIMYYCWTHGLGTFSGHTSQTCKTKAEGHQDTATVSNMMGGSTIIRPPAGRQRREARTTRNTGN